MSAQLLTNGFDSKVRISKIRSRNPMGFGGCIFSGYEVNDQGDIVDSAMLVVVITACHKLPALNAVQVGETWQVTGTAAINPRIANGFRYTEKEVNASALYQVRETGDLIIDALATNPKFSRIGPRKARQLWNRFGRDLYRILDTGDVVTLTEVLSKDTATNLVAAWRDHVSGHIYSFLQSTGFPVDLAKRVVAFYGNRTDEALKEDPYRLLSFSGRWSLVDALAKEGFGIAADDERRLTAAIEESLYRLMDKNAHTAVPTQTLVRQLITLLGKTDSDQGAEALATRAIAYAAGNGAYVVGENGLYWSVGAFVMEEFLAKRVASMVMEPEIAPSLFVASATAENIEALIRGFEAEETERHGKAFSLTSRQRQAVITSVSNRFSIISGGAGTGKTTVLKAVYYVLGHLGYSVRQMALSGRAAKRMQEATGVQATTIAAYLKRSDAVMDEETAGQYFVIDEASMLDLPTTYRIFRTLSDGARVILVGDPYQLPPIMAGLTFHVLTELDRIPTVELEEVKRQQDSTGIPTVARSVRFGMVPEFFGVGTGGVQFLPCDDRDILSKTVELFALAPDTTQIISATKNCTYSGTRAINAACCATFSSGQRDLLLWRDDFSAYATSGFREGDRIMFIKNDWKREVTNGSIGHIVEVLEGRSRSDANDIGAIAKAIIDGVEVPIYHSDIDSSTPFIEHGYAVTVHKAQGSQWQRIIMPVRNSRLLDRTLIYTAITRAEAEVILIGNIEALNSAIIEPPRVQSRSVGFGHLINKKLRRQREV